MFFLIKKNHIMKKFYKIGLIILALIITQQSFPQKENAKSPLRGEQEIEVSEALVLFPHGSLLKILIC